MPYASYSYTATNGQTDFALPTSLLTLEDEGIDVDAMFTVDNDGVNQAYEFDPVSRLFTIAACTAGDIVTITRTTDIDTPLTTINTTSFATPTDVNKAIKQLLFGLQELADRVTALEP